MRGGPFRTDKDEKHNNPVPHVRLNSTTHRSGQQPENVYDGVCMGGPFRGEGEPENNVNDEANVAALDAPRALKK